ncbi:hypothetical protein SSAG_02643 [Streptomyces sp. Mg1]|nr:hypothetical protein SSAG_02643 [Streptomyces sp. Mg1]
MFSPWACEQHFREQSQYVGLLLMLAGRYRAQRRMLGRRPICGDPLLFLGDRPAAASSMARGTGLPVLCAAASRAAAPFCSAPITAE